MRPPFGTYLALASELINLAAEAEAAGPIDAMLARHPNPDVADYFDAEDVKVRDQRRRRVIGALVTVLMRLSSAHMEPPLRQSETVIDVFVFAFADDPAAEPEERDRRSRLRCQPALRRELAALDDRDFELLCGQLLLLMGCDRAAVTRGSKERGIDMLGRLPARSQAQPGAQRMLLGALHIVVVGQAKRYDLGNTIGPEEVRHIVGTWDLILKARANGELEDHLVEVIHRVGVRAEDPALQLIVTTSRFTGPAVSEARDGGVVLVDGAQLAFALVEGRLAIQQAETGAWAATADSVKAACVEIDL